jgi:DNA helicase-2/ATP-dependent DNA helicase PcrA
MRRRDIETISAMAASHPDLDTFLTTLALDYKIDKSSEKSGPVAEQEDPITISTVHSAKGLEWDAVYFPTFTADHIPSRMANTEDEVEEEKRILYVAMTRPRKKLYVIRPTVTAAKGYFAQESRFQNSIVQYFDRVQIGQKRQPASFKLQEKDDYHIDMDW